MNKVSRLEEENLKLKKEKVIDFVACELLCDHAPICLLGLLNFKFQ